ncbi:hypothetical protein AVEN_198961-1 [Araneus ventricosus]|uniref:Uncharacterized protein n=1 Tax=Araneus ventricosus TaxID=182803 RepID=A0A4Y2UWE6_ARAVE|nr:hypothetical protein AVEN_198961-1 [Araneus ventricosus]
MMMRMMCLTKRIEVALRSNLKEGQRVLYQRSVFTPGGRRASHFTIELSYRIPTRQTQQIRWTSYRLFTSVTRRRTGTYCTDQLDLQHHSLAHLETRKV